MDAEKSNHCSEEQRASFLAFLESCNRGALIVSQDGTVHAINTLMKRLFHFKGDKSGMLNLSHFFSEDELKIVVQKMAADDHNAFIPILLGRNNALFSCWCISKIGFLPLLTPNQRLLLFEPLTEKEKDQRECINSSLFGSHAAFLHALSHKFNNPLEGLKNYIYLLQFSSPTNAHAQEIASISQQAARLTSLSRTMSSLFINLIGESHNVDLVTTIEKTCQFFKCRFHRQKIVFALQCDRNASFHVSGYATLLRSMFVTLIACRLNTGMSRLSFTFSPGDSARQFNVIYRDNGVIDETEFTFNALHRVLEEDRAGDRVSEQLLSLYLVKVIMELHRGSLHISSNANGSVFTMMFYAAH